MLPHAAAIRLRAEQFTFEKIMNLHMYIMDGWLDRLPIVFSLVRHHVCSLRAHLYIMYGVEQVDAKHRVLQRENRFFSFFSILVWLSDSLSQTTYFTILYSISVFNGWVCARLTIAINSRYIIIISDWAEMERERSQKIYYPTIATASSISTTSDIHVIFSLLSSSGFWKSYDQKGKKKQCRIYYYYYYFSFATQSNCVSLQWVDAHDFFFSCCIKIKTNELIVNSLLFAMWIGKRMGCQHTASQPIMQNREQDNIFHYMLICSKWCDDVVMLVMLVVLRQRLKTLRDSFEPIRFDLLRFYILLW